MKPGCRLLQPCGAVSDGINPRTAQTAAKDQHTLIVQPEAAPVIVLVKAQVLEHVHVSRGGVSTRGTCSIEQTAALLTQ